MQLALEKQEETALAPVDTAAITPMSVLQMAVSQGADIDKLTKLMELQERWEANQARKAFDRDFAAFKSETVRIIKNISVTAGPLAGKKYANLFSVVDALAPALSRHHLSHSWTLTKDEPNWIEITCTLRHELGHSISTAMGGPPDTGGAKNALQARASSKNYLERYTLLAVTGWAAADGDDDGNGAHGGKMPEANVTEYLEWIKGTRNDEELQKQYLAALAAAKKANDKKAEGEFVEAKNARYRELHSKGGAR